MLAGRNILKNPLKMNQQINSKKNKHESNLKDTNIWEREEQKVLLLSCLGQWIHNWINPIIISLRTISPIANYHFNTYFRFIVFPTYIMFVCMSSHDFFGLNYDF